MDNPSRAAGRCRLVRDGSPGRSAPATVIAWCAGSCWCTAPHPLCANPGVCPWLVLVSADSAGRGHFPDRRGDPWLTAGLRPMWFALRCCAALCGIDAVDYSVAATCPHSTVTVAKCRQNGSRQRDGGSAAEEGGSWCQGGSRHARPVSRQGPRPGSGCARPAGQPGSLCAGWRR